MLLRPPLPRHWAPASSCDFRFGWDPIYTEKFGQNFSPWFFAKNSAAVLGQVRANGPSALMSAMAEKLLDALDLHLEEYGGGIYVANRFPFEYRWQRFNTPFYGAFMNAVTAFGLLQLNEATGVDRYLILAGSLLNTIANTNLPVPLVSIGGGKAWLHEYVYKTSSSRYTPSQTWGDWNCARIYNGHAHALLAFMRHDQIADGDRFRWLISLALQTIKEDFPDQIFKDRFFSYCVDVPMQPDYGQERACRLVEGIAAVTGDQTIASYAKIARKFYLSKIVGREDKIRWWGRMSRTLQRVGIYR